MPPRHDQPKMPEPTAAPDAAPADTAAPQAAPIAASDAAPELSLVDRLSAAAHAALQPDEAKKDTMECPHCGGRLQSHGPVEGPKRGAQHCMGSCGCCLIDGEPRPGSSRCTVVAAP